MYDSMKAQQMFEKIHSLSNEEILKEYPMGSTQKSEMSKALFTLICIGKSAQLQLMRLHGLTGAQYETELRDGGDRSRPLV